MPITERLADVREARQWVDGIPLSYQYTAGVTGEKFLRGLMAAKILAAYCPSCEQAALPARMYCVECYGETTKLVKAGPVGVVRAVTQTNDGTGQQLVFGFVSFPGVKGGMVHKLLGKVRAGSKVKARFKPKRDRTGAISDILGFERAG